MLGPGKNILYVLLNGALTLNPTKKQEYKSSSLAFINLSTGEVTKRVSVGWNAGTVALSDDGKHVVCFAHGQKAGRNFKRDMPSRLTVIDIQTQQVSARISNGFLMAAGIVQSRTLQNLCARQASRGRAKGTI